jgi:hypothetical protein
MDPGLDGEVPCRFITGIMAMSAFLHPLLLYFLPIAILVEILLVFPPVYVVALLMLGFMMFI